MPQLVLSLIPRGALLVHPIPFSGLINFNGSAAWVWPAFLREESSLVGHTLEVHQQQP